MTHTVGAKGQVVIPKELRDRFGIKPGDEVEFWYCDDHLALRPVRLERNPKPLKGRFRGLGLVADLKAERRSDAEVYDSSPLRPDELAIISVQSCLPAEDWADWVDASG